jgi:hypothetical protein
MPRLWTGSVLVLASTRRVLSDWTSARVDVSATLAIPRFRRTGVDVPRREVV